MKSSITAKGQTTIPKEIRDHLQLQPGDKIKFFINPDGSVAFLPTLPVTSLRGIIKTTHQVSQEEMDEAIAEGATSRMRRFLSQ